VEELYRLYLNVYDRARFRLERLTPEFLVRLGSEMPDAVRFFLWRHGGRIVAFSLCTIEGGTLYDEYLGLDYDVAYDLSLYMLTLRDVLQWAIENGFTRYCSTALSYEPKRRLRSALVPLDIYVAHTSPLLNHLCKRLLPLLEPTHRDAVLRRFPDYEALRATR
jgi:predicted N-acyltransferase